MGSHSCSLASVDSATNRSRIHQSSFMQGSERTHVNLMEYFAGSMQQAFFLRGQEGAGNEKIQRCCPEANAWNLLKPARCRYSVC